MRPPNRNSRGYSLVELLTVMAIIGVLSLITVPSFISFQRAGKMKSALRGFTMDLRTMRQRAITQNVRTRLEIIPQATESTASRTYRMYQSNDNGVTWTPMGIRGGFGSNVTSVVGEGTGNRKELEKSVFFETGGTFTDTDSNGQVDVTFLPNGTVVMPVVSGATQTQGTIMLRTLWNVTNNRYSIAITPSGQVHATASHV